MKNNKVINLVKALMSITLFSILIKYCDFQELLRTFKKVGLIPILISFCIFIVSKIISAIKWKIFLPECKLRELNKAIFESQLYSLMLPGQIFGEASKIVVLHNSDSDDSKIMTSVIVDKITGIISLFILGTFGILFSSISLPKYLTLSFVIFSIFSIILLIIPKIEILNDLILFIFNKLTNVKILWIEKIFSFLLKIYNIWAMYLENVSNICLSIFIGIIYQILCSSQSWIISNSIGLKISFFEYMWISPAMTIVLLLPITIGGLGLREVSFVSFLSLFNIEKENALVISASILLSHYILAIIILIRMLFAYIKRALTKA